VKKVIKNIFFILLGVFSLLGVNHLITRGVESQQVEVEEEQVKPVQVIETKKEKKVAKTSTSVNESDSLPQASIKDWNLTLVGPENELEKEIDEASLETIKKTDQQLDKRVIDSYEELKEGAKKAGFDLVVVSAFRSVSYQKEVFTSRVQEAKASGISEKEAREEVKKTSTEPGYSEHHTGLALDVVDEDWQNNYQSELLEEEYGDAPGGKWLDENACEYGFIIRYPKDKEAITKITYEPWHLRYVGVENAKYITKHQLTLEEYRQILEEKDDYEKEEE